MSLILQLLKKKLEKITGGEFRMQYLRSFGGHSEIYMVALCVTNEIDKQEMIKRIRMLNFLWKRYLRNIEFWQGKSFKKLQSLKLENTGTIMKAFDFLEKEEADNQFEVGDLFEQDPFALGVFSYEHPEVR